MLAASVSVIDRKTFALLTSLLRLGQANSSARIILWRRHITDHTRHPVVSATACTSLNLSWHHLIPHLLQLSSSLAVRSSRPSTSTGAAADRCFPPPYGALASARESVHAITRYNIQPLMAALPTWSVYAPRTVEWLSEFL